MLVRSLVKDMNKGSDLKKEKLMDKELNMQIHLPRIYGHTKCKGGDD